MNKQGYFKIIEKEYHIECDDTVIKIPFKNITGINKTEISFKDNDGKYQKIRFDECAKNFSSAFGMSTDAFPDRKFKGVGGRCSTRPIGFYEFFTDDHHIRFCRITKVTRLKDFLIKIGWNAYSKDFSEFYSIERKLNAAGYSTIDLT